MYTAMNHFTTPDFWFCHRHLPLAIRELADKNLALMRDDPHHASVRLIKLARSGRRKRAMAAPVTFGDLELASGPVSYPEDAVTKE